MELVILFLSITLANMLGWLTPGPNMLAVINASVTGGRRQGIITGLGLSTANIVWATVAV